MPKATAITQLEGYKTEIKTGSAHFIIADESFEDGGLDSGATPTELLASSLAACSTITMKMYAQRKGWDLQEAKVFVEFVRDVKNVQTRFLKTVFIKGNLDELQRNRIYEIASRCPVHRILEGSVKIESKLT